MRAPLSIVIPTLNAGDDLPATADALLGGATSGLVRELVISDGGSKDDTLEIAKELGAVSVTGPAGRGGQLAHGVAASTGEWLLLLHADTHLAEGWARLAHDHMTEHADKAGWFRLRFRADGFAPAFIARGANLRSRYLGLPYGDQGLLISRRLLDAVGGVPAMPLMEDVVLARALKGRLRGLDCDALTSAARYEREGWIKRTASNLGTLTRFFLGVSPEALKARYEK
ncbi:MAG: glycosyltransferase [Silicimonas sp.]|nr:glycosyltransferase [Silicimonas sp.]